MIDSMSVPVLELRPQSQKKEKDFKFGIGSMSVPVLELRPQSQKQEKDFKFGVPGIGMRAWHI